MKQITRRKALTELCMLTGASLLSGCAVNPVTGKREFMLMSEREEINLGSEAHGQITMQYGSYNDTTMQEWFDARGQEMSRITHRKKLTYHFTVLDSPVMNAFAVPGGFVYVTRGILGYFNNEAQFAGVLGHELGHVNGRHTAARYSKAKMANLGLAIGSIISEEFNKYAQLASLGTSLLFLKFSRNDEREADRLGVDYSSAVGYDAVEMSTFFKTLERMHPKGGALPAWQSTHPDPGDRINSTRNRALEYQRSHTDMTFFIKKDEYLDCIDGLVFGEDPRQGYAKDNIFYHPELKFQFPIPQEWQVSNMPSEVRMSPENQKALLIFMLAQGSDPRDTAVKFAQDNNVNVSETESIKVNGMSGFKTRGVMVTQEQNMGITSYFIKMDEHIFVFHGLAAPVESGVYRPGFNASAFGFTRITDNSKMLVSPEKISLREAKTRTTLQNALNTFGVPEDKCDELAIVNGMELTDELDAGTRIKIIS